MFPQFAVWGFAAAGLAAAAGPVLIHLLNRRRFRVRQWAAMEFLRKAVQRNRRWLEWRDLLLLCLRTAAVVLFGLALARPFFPVGQGEQQVNPNDPVHAVLVVDNSLSMGYDQLEGTLLEQAKQKASEFIDQLPEGSRVSVLPLCGAPVGISRDPYRSRQDALDALDQIRVVDRQGSAAAAADLAATACQQAVDLPVKRVVFLSDHQEGNWPASGGGESLAARLEQLPEIQMVQVAPKEVTNSSISEFRLQDDVADVETATRFLVTVNHQGSDTRRGVKVQLTIGGEPGPEQTVDLDPGPRELEFDYRFELPVEPGQPQFVPVSVQLTADRLVEDDSRHLIVPVVAALQVVFIDEYGGEEDPKGGKYGQTYSLRKLLSPQIRQGDSPTRQLVQVRHVQPQQVDQGLLEEARLVVVAGIERPGSSLVKLLRDFVRQGGPLVIAAGGSFDPALWQQDAWLEGAGVLPVPLAVQTVGQVPAELSAEAPAKFFRLDPESMLGESATAETLFRIAGESEQSLEDLYGSVYFFKTAQAQTGDKRLAELLQAEAGRIKQQREDINQALAVVKELEDVQRNPRGTGVANDPQWQQQVEEAQRSLADLQPEWLIWSRPPPEESAELSPEELARAQQPVVLASYTNGLPFLVERKLDRGRIVLCTSGVLASGKATDWNILPAGNAFIIFDRLLRGMIENTFSSRNFSPGQRIELPIAASDRRRDFLLHRPNGGQQAIAAEALTADRYGLLIREADVRGHYRVEVPPEQDTSGLVPFEQLTVAVNGPAAESQLTLLGKEDLEKRMGQANYRWIAAGETISISGAASNQGWWRLLLLFVIILLLIELLMLAWPYLRGRPQLADAGSAVALGSAGLGPASFQAGGTQSR